MEERNELPVEDDGWVTVWPTPASNPLKRELGLTGSEPPEVVVARRWRSSPPGERSELERACAALPGVHRAISEALTEHDPPGPVFRVTAFGDPRVERWFDDGDTAREFADFARALALSAYLAAAVALQEVPRDAWGELLVELDRYPGCESGAFDHEDFSMMRDALRVALRERDPRLRDGAARAFDDLAAILRDDPDADCCDRNSAYRFLDDQGWRR